MKEVLRHICDTNRVIALSELFLGNKDCYALAIHFAYHIECLPYKLRFRDTTLKIPHERKTQYRKSFSSNLQSQVCRGSFVSIFEQRKRQQIFYQNLLPYLVETRGIEPLTS